MADGSSLAVGHFGLEGAPNGVTYQVDLVRADGVELLMHFSNERDPKATAPCSPPSPRPLVALRVTLFIPADN